MKKLSKEGKMLYPKEVIEALDGAIEKWYNITFHSKEDMGIVDCPLCDIAAPCESCPVNNKSGDGCSASPYGKWAAQPHRQVVDSETAELAYNFYKWLKNLREEVDVEEDVKPKFVPLTLTIETLEEAQELYHRLYPSSVEGLIERPKAHPYPGHNMDNLWNKVWQHLQVATRPLTQLMANKTLTNLMPCGRIVINNEEDQIQKIPT